jgi:hypothetical protein
VETTAVVAMLGVSLQRLHGLAEPMVAFAAGPLSVWQAAAASFAHWDGNPSRYAFENVRQ